MISIVTPFHNSFPRFYKTFESVIHQSHKNFEWIVIDDCSSEDQRIELERLAETDGRVRVISLSSNCGAGYARNIGIEHIAYSYLTFIDSDDEWSPDFLQKFIELIDMLDVDIIYGGYYRSWINGCDRFTPKKIHTFSNIFRGCDISCLATMIRVPQSGLQARFGRLRSRNDLIFFGQLLQSGMVAHPVPIIAGTYHMHAGSLSSGKLTAMINQIQASLYFNDRSYFQTILDTFFWGVYGYAKYKGNFGFTRLRRR
jgi:glycosyltransferase involved in cell wall biosynthesis